MGRAQLELTQVRQEIERRIAEKDEEFMGVKKNMGKAIEGMQAAFEQEGKGKAEGLRMKKKLEGDVGELEIALEHSNANNLETQKAIKKYQIQIRDAAAKLEEEQRAKEHARDALVAAERKSNATQNALEEARTLLEQADRNRRTTEQELADVNESLSDATVANQAIAAAKRKLDSELQTLHADFDEMSAEARLCEEKASKAMVDAAKLADELRAEQEGAQGLESELDAENRRFADAQKNLRKSERRIKELTFGSDEDRKNHQRMQSLVDQLQGKIKAYKKQIEEAEEIAALNLAKFRKVQGALSEAEARADLNESALAKSRARGGSVPH